MNRRAATSGRTMRKALVHHRKGVAAAGVVVAVSATWIFLGTSRPKTTVTAENVSQNLRACLVTGPTGAQDAPLVQGSWDGLQEAASHSKVNAQRFSVPDVKPDVALPYINGAVQQKCKVIITVGPSILAATESAAAANPRQRFAIVGSTSTRTGVTTVAATDGSTAKAAVSRLVSGLVSAH
ncbi:basic membrane protein A [Actinacidiphila alni]|uniref:Basic membrane protein A n=1 Tax=Actinacidiphila alni TaxID=380248 RepID=A0A1I2JMQ4_9ACTN|nr:hypothetical protein [Actinacidiphila alni]SFF55220.1 basic membrane protein A [Actinacidiphila alni]